MNSLVLRLRLLGRVDSTPRALARQARTAIAQDRDGRVVIIVCPQGAFTLRGLAIYLLGSNLELDVALNLDGGASTGLSLRLGKERLEIPGLLPVPAVITISPA